MSVVTQETIIELLLKVEQAIHSEGWDGRPVALTMDVAGDGTVKAFRIPFAFSDEASLKLQGLAEAALTRPDLAKDLHIPPTFMGTVFVFEAWGLMGTTSADLKKFLEDKRAGKRLADHPNRQEVRQVAAVDIVGRPYWITRPRDEEPTVFFEGKEVIAIGGAVLESLRILTLALARSNPGIPADLEALRMLWVDQIDDTMTRLDALNDRPIPG